MPRIMPGGTLVPVIAYAAALERLLQRARDIKPIADIEPALHVVDLMHDGDVFANTKRELTVRNQQASSTVIETAIRNTFFQLLASTSIDEPAFGEMWNLLDIVSIASDSEQCEAALPFALVEELLDSQTIHGCRKVFDYLETRRERMIAKHWKQKQLTILRTCNELLRRLSRAEDTVFCGRVFIFLFQSFPLGDKSSVNLRGEYHTDNVTVYDQSSLIDTRSPDHMEVDCIATEDALTEPPNEPPLSSASQEIKPPLAEVKPPADTPTIKLDPNPNNEPKALDADTLYPMFWSLQEYFAQPTMLFDSSSLHTFKTDLEATMVKFKEVHKDLEPSSSVKGAEDSKQGTKRKFEDMDGSRTTTFNPKYLTSRDLFELEISELAFRRHILVQALIVTDFLLLQTPTVKSKLENLKNRSVIYDYVLDEKDAQWAINMRSEIANYLQQGPEGAFYYRMVNTVLSRDRNWLRWKAESCPPFQLPSVQASEYSEAQGGAQRATVNRRLKAMPLGALDLNFLSDASNSDGLEKLKRPERYTVPNLETFRGPIADDEFDIEMAKSDEQRQVAAEARAGKLWRALRIASKSKFGVFDKIDDGNNLKPLFELPEEDVASDEKTKDRQEGLNGQESPEVTAAVKEDGLSVTEMQMSPETKTTEVGETAAT